MHGSTPFQLALDNGQVVICQKIVTKFTKSKAIPTYDSYHMSDCKFRGYKVFHWACKNNLLNVAEELIKNSSEFNLDLNAKTYAGYTGFHLACLLDHSDMVQMIRKNSATYDIDLNTNSIPKITSCKIMICLMSENVKADESDLNHKLRKNCLYILLFTIIVIILLALIYFFME